MAAEKKSRCDWSDQFKVELVEQLLLGKATVAQLSSRHGINPSNLYRWRKEYMDRGADLSVPQRQQELRAENRKLKRHNKQQERIVDFLAKELGEDTAAPSAK